MSSRGGFPSIKHTYLINTKGENSRLPVVTSLACGVVYYDFYWFKKIGVNQDRTCALS